MSSTVKTLDAIRDWLQENVCKNIKLKQPSDDNVLPFNLVVPTAYSAYMPIKKNLPSGIQSAIPGVIVAFDEAKDNGEWLILSMRLIHGVYSPGEHSLNKGNMVFTPNNDGWRDLLNYMDKTKAEILKKQLMNGFSVDLPLTEGLYNPEEQTPDLDPYYFGWISFDIRCPAYPKSNHINLL